ncbi:MAG: hypothetical protein CMJ32_08845 [Phycisphaerae bacterium]|nr:hypothetical protein [Phycisphaerae bacterium]
MQSSTADGCPERAELESWINTGAIDDAIGAHVQQCEQCGAAVDSIRSDNDLIQEFLGANSDRLSATRNNQEQIPGYEVGDELHRGGQGVVFKGLQVSTRRTVALKMLLQGRFATSKQRLRFEREVEVVASLRHPNIVTLYESGLTTDGQVYFAMEFVDGQPADDFLEDSSWNSRQILGLVSTIARAVSYAHQRGVIHRDIKPANVLVDDEGQPHVLDFGLARNLDEPLHQEKGATAAGEFLGTFAYAAPEQLSGKPDDIDVRTDVYALGIMLYEMLTGLRPFPGGGSISEIISNRLEREPQKPSKLTGKINNEIETIILKAMAREPERRYQSAGELADDIDRYLEGLPILARSDSSLYVLGKMARRYRRPLAAALIASAMLLTLMVVLVLVIIEGRFERRSKEQAYEISRRISEALNLRGEASADMGLPEIVSVWKQKIQDPEFQIPFDLRTMLLREYGKNELELGSREQAIQTLRTVLQMEQSIADDEDARSVGIAETLHQLGRVEYANQNYREALVSYYLPALEMRTDILGEDHPDRIMTLQHVGATKRRLGMFDQARLDLEEVLRIRQGLGDTNGIINAMNAIGFIHEDDQAMQEAHDQFAQVGDLIRQQHDSVESLEDDYRYARALHSLARCQTNLGRYGQARENLDESIRLKQQKFGPRSETVALGKIELANTLLLEGGDPARAEMVGREALDILAQGAGRPEDEARTLMILGRVLVQSEQLDRAIICFEQARQLLKQSLGAEHYKTIDATHMLGRARLDSGQHDAAEALLISALGSQDSYPEPSVERKQDLLSSLVRLYTATNEPDKARIYRQQRDTMSDRIGISE